MTQPYLYLRNRSSTLPQAAAFKEINRQLIQIGADFGESDNASSFMRAENKIIHWSNSLLAINATGIWQYDISTEGPWTVMHSFANFHGSALLSNTAGFCPCSIDGSGVLVTAYPDASDVDGFRVVKIDKDLNVVEGPAVVGSFGFGFNSDQNHWKGMTSYRNRLLWQIRSEGALHSYDLKTDSLTEISLPNYVSSATPGVSQITIINDKPFLIHQGPTSDITTWRIDGTIATEIGSWGFDHSANEAGCYALTSISGDLYLFGRIESTDKWTLRRMNLDSNGNFVSTEDLDYLLSTQITDQTLGALSANDFAMWRIDQVTNGPENPIYELEIAPANDGARQLYTWNNAPLGSGDSGWTFHGSTMTAKQFSWIDSTNGSSSPFVWPGSGVLNASQPNLSINADGLTIDAEFEIYGPVGESGISLELYFDKEGELDSTMGSLNSATTGTLNGDVVEGLIVGDVVSVNWNAVGDGIVNGDNPKIHARVFIP